MPLSKIYLLQSDGPGASNAGTYDDVWSRLEWLVDRQLEKALKRIGQYGNMAIWQYGIKRPSKNACMPLC